MLEEREVWGDGKMWNGAKTGAFPGSPGLINYFWIQRHGRWHTSILQELMLAIVVTKDWRALRRGKDVSFKRQQLSETTWDRWDLISLPLLLATLASTVYPTQGSILPQLGLHCLFLFHVSLCFHSPTPTRKPLKVSPYLHHELQTRSPSLRVLLHFYSQHFLNNACKHSTPLKLIHLSHRMIHCSSLPRTEGVPRTQDFWC